MHPSHYRIEYKSHGFDAVAFAKTPGEANSKSERLKALGHVSDVVIVDASNGYESEDDRHMFCAQCDFACRLAQLPAGFSLDTEEPDNPWVWCPNALDPVKCRYARLGK